VVERLFKDEAHLVRLVGLLAAGLVGFLLLRGLLVPDDFGVYGHYRAGALDDNRARPVAFAGQDACEACHAEPMEAKRAGGHKGVRCEACHGALARHALADDPAALKPERPGARLCLVCHAVSVARPARFPQVDTKDHAEPGTCLECHAAHQPGQPPEGER
jgi:hypothetical protein